MAGISLGTIDIQFGDQYSQQKMNRLVEQLGSMTNAINALQAQITALQNQSPTTTVPKHVLAGETGLGPSHTVTGLEAGQVLQATSPTSAEFAYLTFGQLTPVDAASFEEPANGASITFVDGYWTAELSDSGGIGIPAPGGPALLGWSSGGALQWYTAGTGIGLSGSQFMVIPGQIDHNSLLNLAIGNPHPQYAELSGAVTTGPWSFGGGVAFQFGFDSQLDSTLEGNFTQSGIEISYVIEDTQWDDGAWALEAVPEMLVGGAVNTADGSYAEDWVRVSRTEDVVNSIDFQGDLLSINGDQVLTPLSLLAGTNIWLARTESSVTINAVTGSGGGSGTVTSVGLSMPGLFSVAGSPVTAAGTLTVTYAVTPSNGQIPIGNGAGYTVAALTAGTAIGVANGSGSITINNTGVTALVGTANEIDVSAATGSITISIDGAYVGQASITTLGTIATGTWQGTAIAVAHGGTGLTSTPANGDLLIGNGSGYTLATLTAGTGVTITNGAGTITIAASGGGTTLLTAHLSSGQSTSSTTFALISGLQLNVAASTYAIELYLPYYNPTGSGDVEFFVGQSATAGSATCSNVNAGGYEGQGTGNVLANAANSNGTTYALSNVTTQAPCGYLRLSGFISFSASGTWGPLIAVTSGSGEVLPGALIILTPV